MYKSSFNNFIVCLILLGFPALPAWADASHAEAQGKRDAIEVFYQEGIKFYKAGEYQKAKEKFLKVQKYRPAYEATEIFLQRIDENLDYQKTIRQRKIQSSAEQQQESLREAQRRAEEIEKKLTRAQLAEKKWEQEYEQLEQKRIQQTLQQLEKQKKKAIAERQQEEAKIQTAYSKEQRRLEKQKQIELRKQQEDARLVKIAQQKEEKRQQEKERLAQLKKDREEKELQAAEQLAKLKEEQEEKIRLQREQLAQLQQQREEKRREAQERLQQLAQERLEQQRQQQERAAQLKQQQEEKLRQKQEQLAAAKIKAEKVVPATLVDPIAEIPSAAPSISVQKIVAEDKGSSPNITLIPNASPATRKQLTQKAQDLYREISASYKAGQYVYALDKTAELREILLAKEVDKNFRQQMNTKIAKVESRYNTGKEKAKEQTEELNLPKKSRLMDIYQGGDGLGLEEEEPEEDSYQEEPAQTSDKIEREQSTQAAQILAQNESVPELPPTAVPEQAAENQNTNDQPSFEFSPEDRLQREFIQKVDALYRDGLEFYRVKSYEMAHKVLSQVEKLSPSYKMTRMYLNIIDHELAKSKIQSAVAQRNKTLPPEKLDVISQTLDEYEQ